ncbi:MAG TPA: transglycosylase SLT domain-containing protein [Rudaea sp.]|nr:transglycosylase SLT domain-containing protein [Rudaea sp.]
MTSVAKPAAAGTARDLGLALFGGCCTAIGGACLLLAACATGPTYNAPPAEPEPIAAQPPVPPAAPAPAPAPVQVGTQPVASPWPRLRARFSMPGCDYNASVQHWARIYAQGPNEFTSSLSDAMPYLLLVLDQIEQHQLPGEFAFLPYVESNYTAIASTGDRAAGIWQLMPDTAQEAGLRISNDYDGRLDIYASTVAAIGLLKQYHEEFGDWRLADMAFNAGMYKVRQLLAARPNKEWTAHEMGRLRVNPGTHDHLAKLLAMACIVSDPWRYRIRLPEPHYDDAVAVLSLPAPVDLRLAARLAGIDDAQLRHLNPGFLRGRMPAEGPLHLVVPASRRLTIEQTLGKMPQYVWRDWHEAVLKQPETIEMFAMLEDLDSSALATVNGVAANTTLTPGTRLLLPGPSRDTDLVAAVPAPLAAGTALELPGVVVVHAGDTLWDIARRFGLHVEDLLRWNGLTRNATLHLGQRLLLSAPEQSSRR